MHQEIKLLTINQAAELLNVKISWLRSAIFKKEIPYIKLGHLIRFKSVHLYKWLENQSMASELRSNESLIRSKLEYNLD